MSVILKKITKLVVETTSFGNPRRYLVGMNPVSNKMFKFAGALPSIQDDDGTWSHARGHKGCGYSNWEITHHDGIHPDHKYVELSGVDYHDLPNYQDSW